MSKPILWLGPLEEIDVDFDPLLGASANALQPKAGFVARKATFDPTRSVFDDPIAEADLSTPSQTIALPAAIVGEQLGDNRINEPVDLVEPAIETVPEPELETVPEPEPTHTETSFLEPTDFTHNNDPIPARQEPLAAESNLLDPSVSSGDVCEVAAAPAKKTFFANLFSKREIAPAVTFGGASINDIWAKAVPEVVAVPEPIVDEATKTVFEPDAKDEPFSNIADEPVDSAIPEIRNIWAVIEDEPVLAPADPAVIVAEEAQSEPDHVAVEAEVPIASEPSLSEAEAEAEIAIVLDEVVETTPETPSPLQAEQPDPQIIDEPVDPRLPLETDLSPEPEHDVNAKNIADEPPPPTNFQNAFNADKFWAIPASHKQNHSTQTANETETDAVVEAQALSQEPEAELGLEHAPAREDEFVEKIDLDTDISAESPFDTVAAPTQAAPRLRPQSNGKRRKRRVKKNYVGAFFGTFLFCIAAFMTAVSTAAPLGYPFDMVSSYRWYWVIMAVVAAAIWGLSRGWKMVIASFAIMGVNLFVTVPASGNAPTGGNMATAVVGWANVAGNGDALARVFKDAEKKKATLLMLAEAPQSVLTPPAGWTLIEAPLVGDPTAIAVLSKTNWRAVTVPGEPTMARPPAGDLTIIGVHPQDANKGRRRTPMRDALINRAGTRAGIQDGPTVVLGDFNAAAWDGAMGQFREYGNVTRVRCGGWAGATLTQAFGLIGVATDHAFVRDITVTHCQLGGTLTGSNHKPIWLYVAPKPQLLETIEPR